MIAARKFYATLPHKLDKAQEEWLKNQPDLKPTVTFTEELSGETQLGGELNLTNNVVEKNQ